MPEYFQISFIAKAVEVNQQNKLQDLFLKVMHLQQGENHLTRNDYPLLQHKRVLFHTFQYEDVDYIECTISIPDVVFYKKSYENDFIAIEKLVKGYFKMYSFDYAVCSYEMNSYFITNVKSIDDMGQSFLLQFSLYFTQGPQEPIMHVNLNAQDIFIDEH